MLCSECLKNKAESIYKWKIYNLISIVCNECAKRLLAEEYRQKDYV